ncbi:MAG: cation:proton antiporter [bacterium]
MNSFLSLGLAAIAGFAMGRLMNKIKVPAVAGYVLIGFILGKSILGVFSGPKFDFLSVEVITPLALSFIAFSIGSELQWGSLKELGKTIILISICEAFGAFILVGVSSYFLLPHFMKNGNNFQYASVALLLAAVASATAPAATMMVLHEIKAKGDLTKTLMAVVAIDDAIALILYGFSSSIAKSFLSVQQETITPSIFAGRFWSDTMVRMILVPLKEITLAILLGIVSGAILSLFITKFRDNEDLLIVTTGILIITAGISLMAHFDELLACMALGIVLSNVTPLSSLKVFRMTNNVAPPIYCMFFVLAGAHLRIGLIREIGLLGICYILMRILGKILGAYFGAWISNAPKVVQKYLGFGLLSQIGVAVGLAMIIRQDFQNFAIGAKMSTWIINILLFTTLFTEIIGPICTKYAVVKAGEAERSKTARKS